MMIFFALLLLFTACQQGEAPLPTVANQAIIEANSENDLQTAVPNDQELDTPAPETETPLPPTPSATPPPPKELAVCVSELPENLYLYGDRTDTAVIIRQAVYEPMVTTLGYAYQAQGLISLPSVENGAIVVTPVPVSEGTRVLNSAGNPVTLRPGVQVETASGELVTYDGETPVEMTQIRVDFELAPRVWSDGTPLTAADSVFSFNIAGDRITPFEKTVINRTALYEAVGERTLRWVGLPGYVDRTPFLNVWTPLPSHQLTRFTAAQLLEADESSQTPLGYGAYFVEKIEENELVLRRNPHYSGDGASSVGLLRFLVEADGLAGVQNGTCQIALADTTPLEQTPDILAAHDAGAVTAVIRNSLVFEHIEFGINPQENYAAQRPDWFEDPTLRKAFMHCIDRQAMIDAFQFGQGELLNAFVSNEHPLFPLDATFYPYDPVTANAMLDGLGFVDSDEDGVRDMVENGDRVITTPISITIATDDFTPLRQQINEMVVSDLAECGIRVRPVQIPASDWYADGPFSPLFGRRFDLGTFAWLSRIEPPCNLYLTRNITGPEEEGFGGWGNVNASGWSNEAFDAACETGLAEIWNTAVYQDSHREALQIFTEELPMMPLFSRFDIVLLHPDVRNFEIDATQPLGFWNAAEVDLVE